MELFRFMHNTIIEHISPDKIWDIKYNKRNKLLTYCNYSRLINENEDKNFKKLLWTQLNNDIKKSTNKLLFMKNPKLEFKGVFYLFLLVLFYCCVLIKATKITNHSDKDYFQNNSLKILINQSNENPSINSTIDINSIFNFNSNLNNYNNQQLKTTINDNNNNNNNKNFIKFSNNLNENKSQSKILNESHNEIKKNPKNYDNKNGKDETDETDEKDEKDETNLINIASRNRKIREASSVPDDEDYDSSEVLDEYDILINNKSAKGKYIGAPCNENKCETTLLHVSCDPDSSTCSCDKNYPVIIGLTRGCDKPKKLGEQCFYHQTCTFNDENSLCVQIKHNARCQCANGFHSVSYSKPTKRIFCTQDIAKITSDLPTLLGVTTGIAVLAGLICMVLHLFSKTKYPRHRNFGDANLPPPIMYSSDTGIPLTVQSGRPSSRSSIRSSGSIGSYGNRRSSSTLQSGSGSKGILVSTSRTGSRRPSLASVHSTSSSVRSYSMMRFEKEVQQKEIRCEMKQRLARLQQQQQMSQNKPQIIIGDALTHGAIAKVIVATPSPLTPNSTDELLPSVDETQEYPLRIDEATFFGGAQSAGYHGPCSSSIEGL